MMPKIAASILRAVRKRSTRKIKIDCYYRSHDYVICNIWLGRAYVGKLHFQPDKIALHSQYLNLDFDLGDPEVVAKVTEGIYKANRIFIVKHFSGRPDWTEEPSENLRREI